MNIPESWAIFAVGLVVSILIWIFNNAVLKRIDKMEAAFRGYTESNALAHKEIWIELHKVDKEHGERIGKLETRLEERLNYRSEMEGI